METGTSQAMWPALWMVVFGACVCVGGGGGGGLQGECLGFACT